MNLQKNSAFCSRVHRFYSCEKAGDFTSLLSVDCIDFCPSDVYAKTCWYTLGPSLRFFFSKAQNNVTVVQYFIIITDLFGEHDPTDWSTVLQHFGDRGVSWNGFTKGDSGSDMPSLSRSRVRVSEKPRDPPGTGRFINAWLKIATHKFC